MIDGGSSVSDFEPVAVTPICWQPAGTRRQPAWPPLVVDGHRLCYHDLHQQSLIELYKYAHSGFHTLLGTTSASAADALAVSDDHPGDDAAADLRELHGLQVRE